MLCGSSMSFMEHQVLGYQSPLYGRRTCQYKIEPFDFFQSRAFLPLLSNEDAACVYGMTGGVPLYLSYFSSGSSLAEMTMENILKPSAFLFEEPSNLLKQELRESANYNAILRKIANGKTKLSEIASAVSQESAATSHRLDSLIELGIAEKESPVPEGTGRKPLYNLKDNLFRFWYRFIPPLVDVIQHNNAEEAWRTVKEGLNTYMGRIFEQISLQYLWRENNNGSLPFYFQKAGRWWGNDPIHKKETEIDIVALEGRENAILGECKWRNEETGPDVLASLKSDSLFFDFKRKYYMLFSRSPFTEACRNAAQNGAQLVSFTDMCAHWTFPAR
jgi:AAA+ ATPase superfamily predicted ATPase